MCCISFLTLHGCNCIIFETFYAARALLIYYIATKLFKYLKLTNLLAWTGFIIVKQLDGYTATCLCFKETDFDIKAK